MGSSAYSGGGLRRVRCGWRLRPKLVPPIGSSPGRMRFGFLLLCPSFFGSLGGESGDGVPGTGVPGGGMRRGAMTRRIEWLTRRRGAAPDPARDSSPLDPRQEDGPPWNRPPRWRVGGTTALDGAAVVAAAVGLAVAGMRWGAKIRRMGWLTRRRGLSLGPRQGDAPLGTAHLADTVVGQRPETVRRFRP